MTPADPNRKGARDPEWPEGFYWSEKEGRPVYSPQPPGDASGEGGEAADLAGLADPIPQTPGEKGAKEPEFYPEDEIQAESMGLRLKGAMRREWRPAMGLRAPDRGPLVALVFCWGMFIGAMIGHFA